MEPESPTYADLTLPKEEADRRQEPSGAELRRDGIQRNGSPAGDPSGRNRQDLSDSRPLRPAEAAQLRLAERLATSPGVVSLRRYETLLHREAPRQSGSGSDPAGEGGSPPVQRRAVPTAGGLPETLRAGVEQLSGLAMDDVKVHYGSFEAGRLGAHAFARGTDIHLAPGQEQHLPHEAWHVVQQKRGRVRPTTRLGNVPINDDPHLEGEADRMGRRALSAASSPVAGAVQRAKLEDRPVPAAPPVQGMWAFVQGNPRRRFQFRTDPPVDGEPQTYSRGGQRYVEVGLRGQTRVLEPYDGNGGGAVRNKRKRRQAPQEPPRPLLAPPVAVEDDVEEPGVRVKVRRVAREQEIHPGPGLAFGDLRPVQKEQVLALALGIRDRVRGGFERAMADRLGALYAPEVAAARQALPARDRRDRTPRSRRDQSRTFRYPVGVGRRSTPDIGEIHKLYGGSLAGTRVEPVAGEVVEESAFSGDQLLPESQYAEHHHARGDRIGGGPDPRLGAYVGGKDPADRQRHTLAAFAHLSVAQGMTLYEVMASAGGDPLFEGGDAIYRNLPQELLPGGWDRTPADLLDPAFLDSLTRSLFLLQPLAAPGLPPDVLQGVGEMIGDLQARGRVTHLPDVDVPAVLWDELDDPSRTLLSEPLSREGYRRFKQEKRQRGDVPAYVAATLKHGRRHRDGNHDWYRRLAPVLRAPGSRGEDLAPGPRPSAASLGTLRTNVAAVAEKLGRFDHGLDVGEKREAVEALIAADPQGAYAINRYISGNFGAMSDVLDRPWEMEGNEAALQGMHDAVRGLEGLPVHQGWAYRREQQAADHHVGEIISPGVLWSASLAPKFGDQFDPSHTGTVFAIHGLQTGRDVQLLAGQLKWYQREVLFPPYARFVVESREEDTAYGTLYVLKELPMEAAAPGAAPMVDAPMADAPQGHYDAGTEEVLRTLIDRRHWEEAVGRHRALRPWTAGELEALGIEGLGAGIHLPSELYGRETAERWGTLLRHAPSVAQEADMWTVDGFRNLASELTGKPQELRDYVAGWGSGDDAYFELGNAAATAAAGHGLRVGGWYLVSDLSPGWQQVANDQLPQAADYRDDSGNLLNEAQWVQDLARKVGAARRQARRDRPAAVWLWRPDAARLEQAGALQSRDDREYAVKYGPGNRGEVEVELQAALAGARDRLAALVQRRDGNQVQPEQYSEEVTRVAAELQQRIVAIHPLADANGRLSRLYMYKVLQGYLPAGYRALPVLPETGADLTTTTQEWGDQLWDLVRG